MRQLGPPPRMRRTRFSSPLAWRSATSGCKEGTRSRPFNTSLVHSLAQHFSTLAASRAVPQQATLPLFGTHGVLSIARLLGIVDTRDVGDSRSPEQHFAECVKAVLAPAAQVLQAVTGAQHGAVPPFSHQGPVHGGVPHPEGQQRMLVWRALTSACISFGPDGVPNAPMPIDSDPIPASPTEPFTRAHHPLWVLSLVDSDLPGANRANAALESWSRWTRNRPEPRTGGGLLFTPLNRMRFESGSHPPGGPLRVAFRGRPGQLVGGEASPQPAGSTRGGWWWCFRGPEGRQGGSGGPRRPCVATGAETRRDRSSWSPARPPSSTRPASRGRNGLGSRGARPSGRVGCQRSPSATQHAATHASTRAWRPRLHGRPPAFAPRPAGPTP